MKKCRLNDLESVYKAFNFANTTKNILNINKPIKVLVIRFCLIANNKSPINTLNGKDKIINIEVLFEPPANKLNKEKNMLQSKIPRTFCFLTVLPMPFNNRYTREIKNNNTSSINIA